MSCLTVIMNRVGGVEVAAERVGGATACMERKGGMGVDMGLVCTTSVGVIVLWAADYMLLTVDNGYLFVK